MRVPLMFGTVALFAAFASPAFAQSCGGEQTQAGASMCSGMKAVTIQTASNDQSAETKKSGCACCRNMATMQAPKNQSMPGMEMPTPEPPKANP